MTLNVLPDSLCSLFLILFVSPFPPFPLTPLAAPLFQPLLPRVDASFVLPSQPWGKNASRCSQLMRRMVLLSEAHNWHRARVTGAGGWAQRPGARARTFSRGFAVNLLHKSALNRPSKQFSSSKQWQAQFIRANNAIGHCPLATSKTTARWSSQGSSWVERGCSTCSTKKEDMPRFISQIICMESKFCVGNKENKTV